MATYDIAEIKTKLQTLLRDTTDTKWLSGEKDEILQESINDDTMLSYEGSDSSLTASSSTYQYNLPGGIDNIRKIIITSGSVDYPVGKSEWREQDGDIYFKDKPKQNGTMKLIGRKQYTIADEIPDKYLNYIMASAIVKAYELLMVKYQSGILMSDVSQAEILTALNYWGNKKEEEIRKIDNKVMVDY
jgi:hypothetical protein